MCEDFAPRNGAARDSEEGGANRARKKPAGGSRGRGKCVKILLPETEPKGLAGSGEQTAPGKKRRASSPEIPGPRFAPENRNRGDEREPWWPPGLQPRNPRPEVRARKPKAGRRARTMAAAGPPTPKSSARGSRPKTENKGLAGSRARTVPAAGTPTPKSPGPGFASENRKQRASGEPSANRAGRRASGGPLPMPGGPTLLTEGPASMPGGPTHQACRYARPAQPTGPAPAVHRARLVSRRAHLTSGRPNQKRRAAARRFLLILLSD